MARELDDAAVGRERAAQDREAAGRLERRAATGRRRPGPGARRRIVATSSSVRPSTPRASPCDHAGADELASDEADAARGLQVGRDVAAARLQVGDDRRARRRSSRSPRARASTPDLARDREQVEDAVRRAARAGDGGDRVLERLARQDRATGAMSVADDVHHDLARLDAPPAPCRDASPGCPRGRAGEMPRKSITSAIVLAVNWPPHAPAPGQAHALELVHVLVGHAARRRARRPPRRRPGSSRRCRGSGRARSSRCRRRDRGCRGARAPSPRPGIVLSQPTRQTRPSNRWPCGDELDRVGDHLARDQRRAHAGRPHRDAVGDGDRVELDRRAAGGADARPSRTSRARAGSGCTASSRSRSCATPTSGFARSSSVKPTAFSIARAGARSTPSVSAALRRLAGSVGCV